MPDLEKNNLKGADPPQDESEETHKSIFVCLMVLIFVLGSIGKLIIIFTRPGTRNLSSSYEYYDLEDSEFEELTSEDLMMHRVNHLLYGLPEFSKINCPAILAGNENEIQKAKDWKIQGSSIVWDQIEISDDKCKTFKQSFVFLDRNLTREEAEYPLAYGALVYKDIEQVTYMLSALYRPNNVYVFMVDKKASDDFKERIQLFSKCFPNIYVKFTEKSVEWAEHEIAQAVFDAVKILTESKYEWKYFQYISGFTLPLKTNLEMVRIFKELNGSVDLYLTKYNPKRLTWANYGRKTKGNPKNESDSPLPLFISNLAASFSRETAEVMVKSTKVEELIEFLKDTVNSDESLWGTILGNPNDLEIPGGFNGTAVNEKIEQDDRRENPYGDPKKTRPNDYTFVPSNYYISRYHIWEGKNESVYCKGKIVHYSCVFGVGDLPMLITRPELVAHKFYFDFEPAAYFCLYQNHWKRTLNLVTQQKFNATPYRNLAFVQANRGIPIKNITFFYM